MTSDPPPISGYLFDNNLSPEIVAGMKKFGEDVFHLIDRFPRNAKDEEFIPELGKEGLILITQDTKIRKKKLERQLIRTNLVGAFLLINKEGGGNNASLCATIEQVIRHWRIIKRESRNRPRPFFIAVRRFGTKLTPLPLSL